MLSQAGPGRKAVVIGGGLLGLEAARGLQLRGCDVTVVHLNEHLMNVQLDPTGGLHLQRKIEELGIVGRRSFEQREQHRSVLSSEYRHTKDGQVPTHKCFRISHLRTM